MFTLSGRTILIADDVKAMRAILRSLLYGMQADEVIEANDGGEAMALLQARRIDLLITDLNMAPIGGIELTKKLRQKGSRYSTLPILMISGHRDGPSVNAALAAGINEFLLKPLVPLDFASRLEAMLTKPRNIVQSATYQGPDRRRRDRWVRNDRRRAET